MNSRSLLSGRAPIRRMRICLAPPPLLRKLQHTVWTSRASSLSPPDLSKSVPPSSAMVKLPPSRTSAASSSLMHADLASDNGTGKMSRWARLTRVRRASHSVFVGLSVLLCPANSHHIVQPQLHRTQRRQPRYSCVCCLSRYRHGHGLWWKSFFQPHYRHSYWFRWQALQILRSFWKRASSPWL
jgi:hypothetical protein